MNFKTALMLMKNGEKMKLPTWSGYWIWDKEKKTILMYIKDGSIMDIKDTLDLEYTLTYVLSNEWMVALPENTPILGGEVSFGFDKAIKYVKEGEKLTRKGWNGKKQYIELASFISYVNPDSEVKNADHLNIGNCAIAFVGTSGTQIGWLASQSDMLADDWTFYKE